MSVQERKCQEGNICLVYSGVHISYEMKEEKIFDYLLLKCDVEM